eukprot:1459249-Pleurochrysis_carterae.AAC.1
MSDGLRPGVTSSVVYFWARAPRAHCGNKVMRSALSLVLSATISGTIHSGAWRLLRKSGDSRAPRSAGCSRMYSAPESRAALSSAAVRRTSSFASCSSRSWLGSTSGRPST